MADAERLQEYIATLQDCVKEEQKVSRVPLAGLLSNKDFLRQLAEALLDGVMFDIIDSLRELQLMTEANLCRKREELQKDHQVRRKQFTEESEKQVLTASAGSKQLSLQERSKLLQNLDKQFAQELTDMDKSIVLEMDKRLSDQQSTLQRAGLPGFTESNEPADILFQMQIMQVVTRLEHVIGRIQQNGS